MNEFNPFDDLGITFDNSNDNRRDRQYTNPFDDTDKFTVDPGNQPDFVLNDSKQEVGDWEVRNELGIELDNSLEDLNVAQEYVNALSEEDYQTWRKLRDEGYSVNATKTLMDNQDLLYDVNETGNKKFYSGNQSSVRNALMDLVQDSNILYEENIHPRSVSAQDWLNERAMNLDEKYSRENIYGKNIEKIDPYNNTENNLVKWGQIYSTSVVSNLKREGIVLAKMGIQLASLGVNFFDNLINLNLQAQANLVNPSQEKIDKYGYDTVTINPEKRATILGSYLQMVEDVFGVGFVAAYPVASFLLTELADSSPTADSLLSLVNGGFEKVAEKVMDLGFVKKWTDNNLSEIDKEYLRRDIAQGLFIVTTAVMGWGGKKFSQTEMYKNRETSLRVANEFGKRGVNESLQKGKSIRDIIGQQPEGTELLNKKGKTIAVSTENGGELTPRGSLNLLLDAAGSYGKSFKEAFNWRWKNKNKWLVTRDPNAPVGELPGVPMTEEKTPIKETPVEEIKPKEEVKIEDLKETPKPNLRKAAPKVETSKGTMGEGIGSFIKRVTNSLAGTEGGLNQEMITKLQNSPQLQNEYVNTIDPYLRSNGAENPAGVIKDQLADFVQTAKDQLEIRRNNNMEFRKGQMKYKVEIPESEKLKWKLDDLELKNLIKMLSKSQDNPEQFLKYLLNLPKEQIQSFEKYIPDFTQNLGIIQDTLELTKAITKPDIVDKFLNYKSSWGTRRKGFVRKMIYEYLKNKYKEMGVQYNMKEVESMINNMSEQDIINLENEIQGIGSPEAYEGLYSSEKSLMEKGIFPISKIYQSLMRQGYISRPSQYSSHTVNDLLNIKLKRGGTIQEWLDRLGLHLEEAYGLNPNSGVPAGIDVLAKTIYLYKSPEFLPEMALGHEIMHDLQSKLTTKEFLDLLEGLSKSTKGLKRPEVGKSMTEWKSLEKTETSAMEYGADIGGLLITHGGIRGLADFLQSNLSSKLGKKVRNILNETGKEIRDSFSTVLVDGKEWNPTNELNKLIDMGLESPEKPSVPLNKEINKTSHQSRVDFMKEIDPNLQDFEFELRDKENLGRIKVTTNDGTYSWEDYKKTLTPEQIEKLGTEEPKVTIGEGEQQNFWGKDTKFDKYKDALRDIDPDIVGLTEKDGKLYVQVLFESMWERWELPDRPGMVELKTIPIDEFFVFPEDIKKLPEDLQKLIKKDAD